MRLTPRFAAATLALAGLTLAPSAFAAVPKKAPAGNGDVTRAQLKAETDMVFNRADTNKDGFMDQKEFAARMTAVLNRTPPGTPNAPTKEEAQRMIEGANAAYKSSDADGDGKLSRAEASVRPLAAFDMMDANHDGVLTLAEKIAAHKAGAARPPAGSNAAPQGR